MISVQIAEIRARVLAFYRRRGRDLPWRRTRDPYAIWVCEIMAQQTRIAAMLPYWERWMARFPTATALAAAPLDDVLAAWAGLGYYARARSLHAAARELVAKYGGRMPAEPAQIAELPGIGRYTAGAIASIAHGTPAPVVDGNVARIFARVFGIEDDVRASATQKRLWALATALVPPDAGDAPGDFNQGLMDLGATVCTPRSPACLGCPLGDLCVARATGRQDELPRLPARKAVPVVAQDAALVTGVDGAWLLCRRAPRGLFGGLWELPDPAALAGVKVDRRRVLAAHTQQLSHRTIHHRVLRGRLAATPAGAADSAVDIVPGPPYDAARFIAPERVAQLGVSSATAALTGYLLENPTWQTPTRRRRSSAKGTRSSSPG